MNTHAQGIRIMQGTSFIPTSSTAYLVMADNAGFENNEPVTSTLLILKGTGNGTSDIKGAAVLSISGLQVNKTAGQVILRKNISVDGTIDFSGGLLDLNTHKLSLSSVSTLQNESEGSRITGPLGGYVEITQELNAPLGTNPGNIGLAITSGSNMGSTTIRRSHQTVLTAQGGTHIERSFEVVPTTNTGLSAQLRAYYFDAEGNGLDESKYDFFRTDNAGVKYE